ncbi:hypothetical protein [Pseudonocardia acidicola]|uniref:MFS transporter n=1 Tax=Pseudonocardia acidicola TaxID=2724939 RepID=A0ABX1SFR6_9PSEU|nr:hypothetical protein [Pseudonocardia acidicola]NMH99764.1 MFS transporter [Pseudonocardia acidicola]
MLWTNVTSVLVGFAMFASLMTSTQVLQAPVATGYGFGQSLVAAGLLLLPIGISMALFSPVSALLSRRAVVAAVTAGFTVQVGGRTIPAGTAYTVLFAVAAGAALAVVVVSALTAPRTAAGATGRGPVAAPAA